MDGPDEATRVPPTSMTDRNRKPEVGPEAEASRVARVYRGAHRAVKDRRLPASGFRIPVTHGIDLARQKAVETATGGWWEHGPWAEPPTTVAAVIEHARADAGVPAGWPGLRTAARWWGLTVGLAATSIGYGLAFVLRSPLRTALAATYAVMILWGLLG